MKICLDPGHGGSSTGTANGNVPEKALVLEAGLLLREIFQRYGAEVVMTRTGDVYKNMEARCAICNAAGCDAFISLHMDGAGALASGWTVWLYNKATQAETGWARAVLDAAKEVGYTTNRAQEIHYGYRGDTSANYGVNSGTNCPSMLLEMGFLTNDKNCQEFLDKKALYCEAIAKATCAFWGVSTEPAGAPGNPNTMDREESEALRQEIGRLKRIIETAQEALSGK